MAALSNSRYSNFSKNITTAKTKSRASEGDGLMSELMGIHQTMPNRSVNKKVSSFEQLSDSMRMKIAELERLKGVASTQLSKESQKVVGFVSQVVHDIRNWQNALLEELDKAFIKCLKEVSDQQEIAKSIKSKADLARINAGKSSMLLSQYQAVRWLDEDSLNIPHVVLCWDKHQPKQIFMVEKLDLSNEDESLDILEDFKIPLPGTLGASTTVRRREMAKQENNKPEIKDFKIDTDGLGKSGFLGESSCDLSLFEVPSDKDDKSLQKNKSIQKSTSSKRKRIKDTFPIEGNYLNSLVKKECSSKDKLRMTATKSTYGIPKSVSKTTQGFGSSMAFQKSYQARNQMTITKNRSSEKCRPTQQSMTKLAMNKSCDRLTFPAGTSTSLVFRKALEPTRYIGIHGSKLHAIQKPIDICQSQETDDIYYEYLRGKLDLKKPRGLK